ncbi:dual specificity protein phosphatase 1 isoform X1 [Daucus carota subsp. sativus]|uniref:dual specificity protein phosphatase 1 isoform X1 n=1 Tax=Daucus carota subsp. sativus TaxID=79200 RepID=UPI0030837510
MDQLDEAYRGRINTLLRAMSVAKGVRNDDVPCQIEEGLYLGSIGAANNKSALRSLNITHVLTVASLKPPYPNEFKYKIVDVQDQPDVSISRYFDDCFGFIDEAREMGGKILVHCFAGISRSVTIIVAYLIKTHKLSCSEALEHVKSKRSVASPNPGFLLQLQKFEKSLRGLEDSQATNRLFLTTPCNNMAM